MAPKKRKKNSSKKTKKAVPKKNIKKKTVKKPLIKKKASKKVAPKIMTAAPGMARRPMRGVPCICIQNDEGWFCMRRLRNGSLKECDGPFGTQEECESHTCR